METDAELARAMAERWSAPHNDFAQHRTELLQLIAEARGREREACAKEADAMISSDTDWNTSFWNQCAERIAMRIRGRTIS